MNRREKLALSTSTILIALLGCISAGAAGVSVIDASHTELDDAKVPYLDGVKFMNSKQYKEAAETLRQVLIVDRTNSSAALMLNLLSDRINYREFQVLREKRVAEGNRQSLDNAEHLIPYDRLLPYLGNDRTSFVERHS